MRIKLISLFLSLLLAVPVATSAPAFAQELCSGPHCTNGQYWPFGNGNSGNNGGWNNGNNGGWNNGGWNNGNNGGWNNGNNWQGQRHHYRRDRYRNDNYGWRPRQEYRQEWRPRHEYRQDRRERRYWRHERRSEWQQQQDWINKQERRDRNQAIATGFLYGLTSVILSNP